MARLAVVGSTVVLRLNAVERLLDASRASFRLPLRGVSDARVIEKPWRAGGFADGLDFGFVGNTAPARTLLTVSSRARGERGPAAVYVYLNRRSVRLSLDRHESPFSLVVVSTPDPEGIVAEINEARARLC